MRERITIQDVKQKNCLHCNEPVRGRIDKKFCDDFCRNHYNNNLKASVTNLVRNINNALGKNRRILEGLLTGTGFRVRVNKERLMRMGFSFLYHTHLHNTRAGKTIFFCYDYGYFPLGNDVYLVVKRKES
jgi:hypothetical protein